MSTEILGHVAGGGDLTMDQTAETIGAIMEGKWAEEQIALLLTGLYQKGETVDEVAGAARAMRDHMTRIESRHTTLLDTCGTGGDGSGTFNISTAAAIVTAAAGIPVAKHGNRRITSKTGSADVLGELGVNIDATVAQAERCLDETRICFCFAPLMHQSMRHVTGVRKSLGFRTIFNLLGPLCNPANAGYQLLGVGDAQLRPLLASALCRLGTTRSVVVFGHDGLDEVTTTGATHCSEISAGEVREFEWNPERFDLPVERDISSMLVESSLQSAELIRGILTNAISGPPRDIVIMNAAAALWTAGFDSSEADCARAASRAIEDGAASSTLQRLAEVSHA